LHDIWQGLSEITTEFLLNYKYKDDHQSILDTSIALNAKNIILSKEAYSVVRELERIPVRFEHHLSRSWPGLSRPPRLDLLCAFKFEVAGTSLATTPISESKRSKSGLGNAASSLDMTSAANTLIQSSELILARSFLSKPLSAENSVEDVYAWCILNATQF